MIVGFRDKLVVNGGMQRYQRREDGFQPGLPTFLVAPAPEKNLDSGFTNQDQDSNSI